MQDHPRDHTPSSIEKKDDFKYFRWIAQTQPVLFDDGKNEEEKVMYQIAIGFLLVYGFSLLCGAFAWIFVSSPPISFGILARDCIVGLLAVSIPLAVFVVVMYICIRPAPPYDQSVDIFIAMVLTTAAAAGGIGAEIFHSQNAGASIVAGLFGGMIFSLCAVVLYSIGIVCLRREEEEEEPDEEVPEERTRYRVVEHPCGSTIQIAVLQN